MAAPFPFQEQSPVVVVAGYRTAGQPPADAALDELVGDPATQLVQPQPLTLEAVTEVLRRRMGTDPAPEFAADCRRVTGGNPLLLVLIHCLIHFR